MFPTIQLVLGHGQRFDAQITHDEAERLELAPGQIVWARLVRRPGVGIAHEVADAVG